MSPKTPAMSKTIDMSKVAVLAYHERAWGNRKQVMDKDVVETDADKQMISISKKLMISEELNAINSYNRATEKYIRSVTVPAYFSDSTYFSKVNRLEEIHNKLVERREGHKAVVQSFIDVMEERKEEAKALLGDLYNEADYPTPEAIRERFGIWWEWLNLSVPPAIPDSIRAEVTESFKNRIAEAARVIEADLVKNFKETVDHAIEMLSGTKADGKPRVVKDALITNVMNFLENFNGQNVTDNGELDKLVEQAKTFMAGTDSLTFRYDTQARKEIAAKFETIKSKLDDMMEAMPSRKFRFD